MKRRIMLVRHIGGNYKRYFGHEGQDMMNLVPQGAFYAFNDFSITTNVFLVIRAFKIELNKFALGYIAAGGLCGSK